VVRFSINIQKWNCLETIGNVLCFGADTVMHKLTKECNETPTDIMKQHYQTGLLHKHTGNQILGF
jgi:hypothetical protein